MPSQEQKSSDVPVIEWNRENLEVTGIPLTFPDNFTVSAVHEVIEALKHGIGHEPSNWRRVESGPLLQEVPDGVPRSKIGDITGLRIVEPEKPFAGVRKGFVRVTFEDRSYFDLVLTVFRAHLEMTVHPASFTATMKENALVFGVDVKSFYLAGVAAKPVTPAPEPERCTTYSQALERLESIKTSLERHAYVCEHWGLDGAKLKLREVIDFITMLRR